MYRNCGVSKISRRNGKLEWGAKIPRKYGTEVQNSIFPVTPDQLLERKVNRPDHFLHGSIFA